VANDLPDVYLKFEGDPYLESPGSPPPALDENNPKIFLKGECMDDDHPGDKGWIQIKSFDFGFGLDGAGKKPAAKIGGPGKKTPAELQKENEELRKAAAAGDKKPASWGKSGALNFDVFNFTKRADSVSQPLLDICDKGQLIPKVKLVMCRPSGAQGDKKIEFLALTLKHVSVKSCAMTLVNEELPEERVQVGYKFVKLESIWTDNAVGDRRPDQPISAEWDLEKGRKDAADNHYGDDS